MEKITKVHIHVALLEYFQKAIQKHINKSYKSVLSAELVILVWGIYGKEWKGGAIYTKKYVILLLLIKMNKKEGERPTTW